MDERHPAEVPVKNLFANLPEALAEEFVESLAGNRQVCIERIVSRGHKSPQGFWYDQAEAEWVVVLQGEAKLRFDNRPEEILLKPGDHLLIPAHQRHRVEWTSPKEATIWLVVFFGDPSAVKLH